MCLTDPKVLHNSAIAEYVDGGQRDPRKLLGALENLKQRLEDARAEAEFGEADALGDMDPSLTAYNMAVLLYQLKQYARCRTLLEDMFANIEPIDEFLAFKLCFLLLDVYLIQRHADRATEVLAYLEKSFATLTKPADGGTPKENGDGIADAAAPSAEPSGKGGSQVQLSADWPNKKSSRRAPTEITPDEVRSALNLYKAKLALMVRSSKSSKREIKTTLNACAQTTTGLFLKCNLEWQRQNYRKAIKLLNNSCQAGSERDSNIAALYFNNMGCIHHCMRRHQAAAFYFTRALKENEQIYSGAAMAAADGGAGSGRGVSLPTFSCDRRSELEFNCGLQLLFAGRPEAAFAAFVNALELMHSQPRVWLRVGEACAAAYVQQQRKRQQEQRASMAPKTSPLVASVAHANGLARATERASRYLLLETDGPAAAGMADPGAPPEETSPAEGTASTGSPTPPAPTLSFGVKCLRNAFLLCNAQLGGRGDGSGGGAASLSAAEYSTLLASAASGTLSPTDEHTLQLHGVYRLVLLHLSWANLELNDYVPALSWASSLLALDACPPSIKVGAPSPLPSPSRSRSRSPIPSPTPPPPPSPPPSSPPSPSPPPLPPPRSMATCTHATPCATSIAPRRRSSI